MDSGAFSTIKTHGGYPDSPSDYAERINRWSTNGTLLAAVAQDYMCEPWMVKRTGLSVAEHQRLTIERYDALLACDTGGTYIMPVLQGWAKDDYLSHLRQYGDRLANSAWVGVGSICKRTNVGEIEQILLAIKTARPDLRLHGFGIKLQGLKSPMIRDLLETADSMAWAFGPRVAGRKSNQIADAFAYVARLKSEAPQQQSIFSHPVTPKKEH